MKAVPLVSRLDQVWGHPQNSALPRLVRRLGLVARRLSRCNPLERARRLPPAPSFGEETSSGSSLLAAERLTRPWPSTDLHDPSFGERLP